MKGRPILIELYGQEIDLGPSPSKLCIKRWTGALSPEPETVAWIETLPRGGVFYDIGASVGTHSIRAAMRGLIVTAFEPEEESYLSLLHTVKRNSLQVLCVQKALAKVCASGILGRGRSTYTFYASTTMEGQSVDAITLDYWCKHHDYPDYIKLDVDGNEEQIIEGGEEVLAKAKSVLIEVDPVINPNIPSMMQNLGFHYDKAQVESCMIRTGKYTGTANYIFVR